MLLTMIFVFFNDTATTEIYTLSLHDALPISYHTESRIADAGVFYPITPSTEGGELYQQAFAEGKLNVFGRNTIAIETEGEHAAQGGAIAHSVCGKRVVNYTSRSEER